MIQHLFFYSYIFFFLQGFPLNIKFSLICCLGVSEK